MKVRAFMLAAFMAIILRGSTSAMDELLDGDIRSFPELNSILNSESVDTDHSSIRDQLITRLVLKPVGSNNRAIDDSLESNVSASTANRRLEEDKDTMLIPGPVIPLKAEAKPEDDVMSIPAQVIYQTSETMPVPGTAVPLESKSSPGVEKARSPSTSESVSGPKEGNGTIPNSRNSVNASTKPKQGTESESTRVSSSDKQINSEHKPEQTEEKNTRTADKKSLESDYTVKDDKETTQDLEDELNDVLKDPEHNSSKMKTVLSNITNKRKISLDSEYTIDQKKLVFTLDADLADDEYIVLELSGMGEVKFALINGKAPYFSTTDVINVENFIISSIVPISAQYLQKDTSLVLSSDGFELIPMKIVVRKKRHLTMDFNENIEIIPKFAEFVRIKVNSPSKVIGESKETRLQFIVDSNLTNTQPTKYQKLEMYINQARTEFPNSPRAEMRASGSLGYGLIKTLSPSDVHYCTKPSCTYFVTLKLKDIQSCNFFPTVFANGSEINFNSSLSLIEELNPNETVTYKLLMPKSDDTWSFSLIPTERYSIMRINPDTKPQNVEDYGFVTSGKGVQSIIITAKEAEVHNFSHQVFFVTYYPLNLATSSTFKFKAQRLLSSVPIELKENVINNGKVVDGEVVSFALDLKTPKTDTINTELSLTVYSNDVSMVVKECLDTEKKCRVNSQDIENADNNDMQSSYPNRIVKKASSNDLITGETDLNILLRFKCASKTEGDAKTKDIPVSESCKFAIGVIGKKRGDEMNGTYRLSLRSKNRHVNADFKKPIQAIVNTGDVANYKFKVPNHIRDNYKYAIFKIISLKGTCDIYLSRTNAVPNKYDFQKIIKVTNNKASSLETAIYYSYLELDNLPLDNSVYVSVSAVDYCIIELYADYSNKKEHLDDFVQKIDENQIAISQIDDDDIVDSLNGPIYSKLFLFEIPPYNEEMGFLNISVNANKLGLNICVQENVEEFNYMSGCDYFKDSEMLTISRYFRAEDAGTKLFISVSKPVSPGRSFSNLLVEFSIMVSFDKLNSPNIKILAGGQSHSKLLQSETDITYQLNAYYMIESGLISLSTDHPSVKAYVSSDPKDFNSPIAILSHTKFAMRIKKVFQFKQNYCTDSDCALYVKVINSSIHNYRFTLTYTVDDIPIALKDGGQLFIPSDMPQYFISEADNNHSLVFNLFSEKTTAIVYAKILSTAEVRKNYIFDLVDEVKFDYKSELSTDIQLSMSPSSLSKFNPPIVSYYYVPKENITKNSEMIAIYDQQNKTKVRMHSNISKLEPYYQASFSTDKGDFSYFYVDVDEPQGFSVMLSVISGEADLYINPGMFNFTTTDFYWKKSATYKGDEIIITKSMFDKPAKIVNTYTIGVYARDSSEYSVLFMPEFSNLIKVQYQHLLYLKLEKDKNYYFDFFNKHGSFTTYFYAENSDVEISVMQYDEQKDQEFIDMITNEGNYNSQLIFKHGGVPLKHLSSNLGDLDTHYVIRVRAINSDSVVTLAIYDANKPIQAYSEKRFDFVQGELEEQYFSVKLDGDYSTIDIDIKLEFGDIDFYISNDEEFKGEPLVLSRPSQKYVNFKVESTDVIIMDRVYLKVKSRLSSGYSILVKPTEKFKELKAFKTELVYTSRDKDQYLFFSFDNKALVSTESLIIEMYNVSYFSDKPELLFLSDVDVTLTNDSPFIPMPLIDYYENNLGEFKHYQIVPELIQGYYIVKIKKSSVIMPIKISVNINGIKQIEPNGIYKHRLNVDKANLNMYEMYVPEAGEFRFLVQTCSDASIDSVMVTNDSSNKIMKFNNNYVQEYSFLLLDKRNSNNWERAQKELAYPIRRGVVESPGLVQFNVTSSGVSMYEGNPSKLDYFLISEFRPARRSLILKDYVDIYTDKEAFDQFNVVYKFTDHDSRLSLKADLPKIRDQILQDFPHIKKVQYKIYYYILADDPDFLERLSRCGFAAIETVKHRSHIQEKTIKIKEAIHSDIPVHMYFFKNDLQSFVKEQNISILVQLEIYFYEHEEEEFGISLDTKMTQVPYFLLTIPNYYKGRSVSRVLLFIGIVSIAAIIIWLLIVLARLKRGLDRERDYERGNTNVSRVEDISNHKLNVSTSGNI